MGSLYCIVDLIISPHPTNEDIRLFTNVSFTSSRMHSLCKHSCYRTCVCIYVNKYNTHSKYYENTYICEA